MHIKIPAFLLLKTGSRHVAYMCAKKESLNLNPRIGFIHGLRLLQPHMHTSPTDRCPCALELGGAHSPVLSSGMNWGRPNREQITLHKTPSLTVSPRKKRRQEDQESCWLMGHLKGDIGMGPEYSHLGPGALSSPFLYPWRCLRCSSSGPVAAV